MPVVNFEDIDILRKLAGDSCKHLKILEDTIGIRCSLKGDSIEILGDDFNVDLAEHTLKGLYSIIKEGFPIYPSDVWYAVRMLAKDSSINLKDVFMDTIYISSSKKVIAPKSFPPSPAGRLRVQESCSISVARA